MKLALGTAQFGLDYGIASLPGKPNQKEVKAILDLAERSGIDTLDTATSYGNCEQILGNIGVPNWRIVTKVPKYEIKPLNITSWLLDNVQSSLKKLNIKKVSSLLVHDTSALLNHGGLELSNALKGLKETGLVEKIGYSIYSPNDLDTLMKILRPDIIQAPLNVFDQRIIRTGWLQKLASEDIEVHVRSIFLQGLLLMEPNSRPKYFDQWTDLLVLWDKFVNDAGISRASACIAFIKQQLNISHAVIGIDNFAHLEQIVDIFSQPGSFDAHELYSVDMRLIDPFNWKLE